MNQEEKTISKKVIYEGIITDYVVHEVELPNGEISTREIVLHDDAVAVLPLIDEEHAIFVRQFRKPLERSIIEIPAGLMDAGEDPETTALRELEEETAYRANKLTKWPGFYVSPGFTNEYLHIYLGENLERVAHPRAQDHDENIEVLILTLEEAEDYMASGEICDAKTVYAVQMWRKKVAEKV